MSAIILGVLANLLRAYAIFRLMRMAFAKREEREWQELGAYVLFVCATSGGYYLLHQLFVNILTNLGGLFFITLMYRDRIWKKIVLVALIYVTNIVVEALVVFSLPYYSIDSTLQESIYEALVSMGILIVALALEKIIHIRGESFPTDNMVWIGLLLVPATSIVIIVGLVILRESEASIVLTSSCLLLIDLMAFFLYGALQEYYTHRAERNLFQEQVERYANELEITKESYSKVRELQHDLKRHLMDLKFLANQNGDVDVIQYAEDMERSLINPEEMVSSGNKEVDSTLNYLLKNARQALKDVQIHIALPKDMSVNRYVFNVVVGNLLENAIEAAQETEEAFLKIEMKTNRGMIFIKLVNSYSEILRTEEGELLTRKNDKEKHGIGLKSVKKIVEEKNGYLKTEWENGLFTTSVMFLM